MRAAAAFVLYSALFVALCAAFASMTPQYGLFAGPVAVFGALCTVIVFGTFRIVNLFKKGA